MGSNSTVLGGITIISFVIISRVLVSSSLPSLLQVVRLVGRVIRDAFQVGRWNDWRAAIEEEGKRTDIVNQHVRNER